MADANYPEPLARRLALHVLASGSRGNATVVEDRLRASCLVIDCGICKRDFFSRAASLGLSPGAMCGFVITHDHSDHTKGLGVVLRGLRRETGPLPLYAADAVYRVSAPLQEVVDQGLVEYHPLRAGEPFTVGPFEVLPFGTAHDAVASVGFRISTWPEDREVASDSKIVDRLGYMTDTGYVMKEALEALRSVRLLAIESNHDPAMLANGPYPAYLKARIASDRGHLSNEQAAAALAELTHPGLESVVAMHVSQTNNTYDLAARSLQAVTTATVHAASQDRPLTIY